MSIQTLRVLSVAVVAIMFSGMIGCSQQGDEPAGSDAGAVAEGDGEVDPHDVPITEEQKAEMREQTAKFADAVAMIKQLGKVVEQETSAGIPENPFDAHQALDKADLVLQWLPQIARDSGVAKDNWEAVNTSANDLRTLFEQVHQNIDNKQDPDFASVADTMAKKLAELEAIPATSSSDNE